MGMWVRKIEMPILEYIILGGPYCFLYASLFYMSQITYLV